MDNLQVVFLGGHVFDETAVCLPPAYHATESLSRGEELRREDLEGGAYTPLNPVAAGLSVRRKADSEVAGGSIWAC